MKSIDHLYISLMEKLPDSVTGSQKEYEKGLYLLYGKKGEESLIASMKLKNLKKYSIVAAATLLCFFCSCMAYLTSGPGYLEADGEGNTYILRPAENESPIRADLTLEGELGGEKVVLPVELNIKPEGAGAREKSGIKTEREGEKEKALREARSVIYGMNQSSSGKEMHLPAELEGLKNITWSERKQGPYTAILFAGLAILLGAYFSRYSQLEKLKQECNKSVSTELPEFLNKLVLLMNAGLVLHSAFEKAVSDYCESRDIEPPYFYSQLSEIIRKVKETNCPMAEELKGFAERSRNREFMRVANVISDNIHKGAGLVEILQNESQFLWFQRKKAAEEQGKLAETKLAFPLAMQLSVLIMITVAPAMLEM